MLIKSVKLENIRSYLNESIEFPEGSVLLSGDIGSGKSTILAAIEFALFGIKRAELSGNALLRYGKNSGSVELNFDIDSKNITIKRNLKRGKDEIKQESGYIIMDGLKKEATAVELKTIILELLGFPSDLVSKSKDLVYRYTVYTQQEQMKQILIGDVESRLDTLRRVFGIDKYKRIRENTLIVSKFLKEKIKIYQAQIEDFDEKQSIKKQRKQEIKDIEEEIKKLIEPLKETKEKISLKKSEISAIEKDIQEFNNLKKELGVSEANLNNKTSQLERNSREIKNTEQEINLIKDEIMGKEVFDTDFLKQDIKKRQQNIVDLEVKIREINKAISFLEAKKQSSEELKEKISKISECPTCLQEVKDEHKHFISQREDENLIEIDEKLKKSNSEKQNIEKELEMLKEGFEKIRKKESELSLIKLKLVHIDEKTKLVERLKKENELAEQVINDTKNRILQLTETIGNLKVSEGKYNSTKREYEDLLLKERKFEINYAELNKEKETILKLLSSLEEEITKKLAIKEKLNDLKEKDNWLNKHFVNLVANIEKHVMLKIHQEFNDLFKEWFNMLIEDEAINARLDDSFTPIVQQDGYDTIFENMSGGERTSLALAYRLSLNKVINDLITTIKMRDLIILDEPTEGFSTEQLDRVKIVIDQLNLKQVIIVSHESKVEGFVDNIIRVTKDEQISKVFG